MPGDLDRLTIGAETLHDFRAACRLEWLETNGLGGLASSTAVCANTRRYHSLLTVSTREHGRLVLLNKLEEVLHVQEHAHALSCNQYPGTIHPQGHRLLTAFHARPVPTWHFELSGVRLTKRLALKHGHHTVALEYRLEGPARRATLELRPMLSFRDHHSLTRENLAALCDTLMERRYLAVRMYPHLPVLRFLHFDAFGPVPDWYRSFEYELERHRGLAYVEDLFCPGAMTLRLKPGEPAGIVATIEEEECDEAPAIVAGEVERKKRLAASGPRSTPFCRALTLAADQFIVRKHDKRTTILAGYHWFSDWGRDTMIALPGLCLATGRHDEAREVLASFAELCEAGMIPNRLPHADETPDFNTVDASLWMFAAVHELVEATGDLDFVRDKLWPALLGIFEGYRAGTRFGIRQDDDGLIDSGSADTQLTWMDAKVEDWVVTPRHGKAVEICALWYNALAVAARLAAEFGDPKANGFSRAAETTKHSFNATFWNEGTGCLFDVVRDGERDPSIRPNQLLSISLPHPALDERRWASVVDVCERALLTPRGLRSLSPLSPTYRGRYGGDQWERDGAYHQGTVWGWLIGPFLSAYLRTHGKDGYARAKALLTGFEGHLLEAGLGTLSEIFEGDSPHEPRGCIAQAWSVGEVLRVLTSLPEPPQATTGFGPPTESRGWSPPS